MKAEIEWAIGIIRAGPDFKKHGDPYEFVCTLMKQDKKGFLMAASGIFDRETYNAIKLLCDSIGVTEVSWDKKNNKTRSKKKLIS